MTVQFAPEGANAGPWHHGWRYVRTLEHHVGGYCLRLTGEAEQQQDDGAVIENPRIVFQTWKKDSYFEASDELRALSAREGPPARLHAAGSRRRDRRLDMMRVADIVAAPRTCCICREPIDEWPTGAHNADPVTADGDCCSSCNEHIVVPAREAEQ